MPSITFSGDSSDGQRASKELVNALEKLSRQALQTSAIMKASLSGMSKEVDGVSASVKRSIKTNDDHGHSVNRLKKDVGGLTFSLAKLNVAFMALRNVMGILKWPAIITAIGYALQAVNALAGGITALVSSMAPLLGIVGVLPSGILLLAGSLITVKLAFSGLTQAMGGNKEAWAKLTPEAQKFARELQGLKPIVEELRSSAQKGLFPGLEEALKYLAAPSTVGVAKDALFKFGEAVGYTATQLAMFYNRSDVLADLRLFVTQTTDNMKTLAPAWVNFADALRHVSMAAAPLVKYVVSLIVRLSKWASTAAQAGRASGTLAAYFERTRKAMQAWGNIIAGWGGTLLNVLKAARPLGDALTASIGGVGRNLQALTGSVQGQNRLAAWFEEMREPLTEIGKLFTAILGAIASLGASPELTELIRSLRVDLLPILTKIMVEAVGEFGTTMMDLVVQIARLVSLLMGANGPLTMFVRGLASIAKSVADLIENHPELRNFLFTLTGTVIVLKTLGAFKFVGALVKQFTLARVAAGAFQAQMVTGNAAVGASTVALGATIKAALITTGIGAVMVAAGLAVYYIISHWDKLKVYFFNWQKTLAGLWEVFKVTAEAALKEIPRLGGAYFKLFAAEALLAFALILEAFYKLEDWIVPGFGKLMKAVDNKLGVGTNNFKNWAKDLGYQAKDDIVASGKTVGGAFLQEWDVSMGQWVTSTQRAAESVAVIINGVTSGTVGGKGPGGRQSRGQGPGQQGGDSFQIPTSWSPVAHGAEHKTTGLGDSAGNARDYGAEVGVTLATRILAPEDGHVLYYHPTAARGNTGGTMQFEGASKTVYFLSHIVTHLKKGDFVKAGGLLAMLSAKGGPPHLHIDKVSDYKIDPSTDPLDNLPQDDINFNSGAAPAPPKWATAFSNQAAAAETAIKAAAASGKLTKPQRKAFLKDVSDFMAEWTRLGKDGYSAADSKKLQASWARVDADYKAAIKVGGQNQRAASAKKMATDVRAMGAEMQRAFKGGFIDKKALYAFQDQMAEFFKLLDKFKSGGYSPAEIKKLRAVFAEMVSALTGTRDAIADSGRGLRVAKELWKDALKDGVFDEAEIAEIRDALAGVGGKAAAAMIAELDGIDAALANFASAWDTYVERVAAVLQSAHEQALQAFDDLQAAQREDFDAYAEKLRNDLEVAVTFNGISFKIRQGSRTPAEALQEALQEYGAFAAMRGDIASGAADLTSGTRTGLESRARERQAIVEQLRNSTGATRETLMETLFQFDSASTRNMSSKQRAYWDALLRQQEYSLDKQAEGERAAADAAYQAASEDLERRIALERKAFDRRQQQERDALAESYRVQEQAYANELVLLKQQWDLKLITTEEYLRQLNALNARYGVAGVVSPTPPSGTPSVSGPNFNGVWQGAPPGTPGQNFEVPGGTMVWDPATGKFRLVRAPGMSMGGMVRASMGRVFPGTAVSNDSLIARVSPGEMVLTPQQQSRLFAIANGGGGTGSTVVNVYPQGSVIAERDLADTIRAALAPVMRANGQRPI